MRKGIDSTFLHYGIRKEDMEVIELACQENGIDEEWMKETILKVYHEERCAITGINVPELLVASHIVPWAESTPEQKLNPENGICLSALYDKAFDRGLITISPDDYTINLSSALREYETEDYFDKHFRAISGQKLIMPIEHLPNRDFLAWHREKVYLG